MKPKLIGVGFASVDAGYYHTVAIKTDGSLWAWGNNAKGQLGDGTTSEAHVPVLIGTGFASVSAGGKGDFAGVGVNFTSPRMHTVAIKTDGTLWAWGFNDYGQLGDGTTTSSLVPKLIDHGYASASAGGFHTLAVKTDGSLWSWGHNYYGELGNGGDAFVDVLRPTRIGDGAANVAAGYSHSVLVGTGAGLFAWGNGYQVGDGSGKVARIPVRIGSGYASVAAGGEHSLAITSEGRVMAWGDSTYGQLGDGHPVPASSLSPVAVVGLDQ